MTKANRWRIIPVGFVLSAALLFIYELIEHHWLVSALSPERLAAFRITRNIGVVFVFTVTVIVYLFQRYNMLSSPILPQQLKDEDEQFRWYSRWFVHLRWLAISMSCAIILAFGCPVVDIIPLEALPSLLACLLALVVCNMFFSRYSRRNANPYTLIIAQMIVDLVILTLLVQFSGGIDNPFYFIYVVHVAIAGILLRKRDAYLVTAIACSLFIAIAVGQAAGIFPSVEFSEVSMVAPYGLLLIVGRLATFVFVLFLISFFTVRIMENLRAATREKDRLHNQMIRQERLVVLGEVAAGVAHEINNPLHGVKSCIAMIKEKPHEIAQSPEFLDLIEEGLERIALITKRLLQYSSKASFEFRETNINDVVKDSIAFVEHRSLQHATEIQCHLDIHIPLIQADTKSLSEVLINLLINAIDAVGKEGRIVLKSAMSGIPNHIEVSIEDNGCGIPAENLEKIFQPFFTTKPIGKGSGLGLSISKRIVEEHKGILSVGSEVGKGTRFILTLPVSRAKE